MTALIITAVLLIQAELLIHIIYNQRHGGAGLEDKPFAYLKEVFKK